MGRRPGADRKTAVVERIPGSAEIIMEQELIFSPQGLARMESGMTAARTVRRPFYIHFRHWLSGYRWGRPAQEKKYREGAAGGAAPLYKGEEMTAQS